jgi:NitT/TauT family transport system substrate-binding protein
METTTAGYAVPRQQGGNAMIHTATKNTQKWTRRVTLAAIALGVALSLGPRAAQSADKITITAGGEGMHYLPVYIARGAGLFAEEGIEVDWVLVGSGTRQAASVMGGSAEMSPLALIHVVKSAAKGANLVALTPIFAVWANYLVLSEEAMKRTGFRLDMSIDDKVGHLKGLKIGITSPGSSTDTFVRKLFLARGMDPDKEVNLQPFGGGAALLAAFEKGLSDGFVFPSPYPEIAEQKGVGRIAINPFKGEVPEMKDVPMVVMATSKETLAAKPDLIRRATRALTKAMIFSHNKPEETKKIMRGYFPDMDAEVFASVVETYRNATPRTPVITKENVDKTVEWMNLGETAKLSVSYADLVALEPAKSVAAELIKN